MKEINIARATALTDPNPLMLVCTTKEDGTPNMAPVSFFMYASFNPPMLAFAMGKNANSGTNIRRSQKAVLVLPGYSLAEAVMKFGSTSGSTTDKLACNPIDLQTLDGTEIPVPADCRIAFAVTLCQTVESGDHYLYLCRIDKILGDESKVGLFAWDGYTKVAPAKRG